MWLWATRPWPGSLSALPSLQIYQSALTVGSTSVLQINECGNIGIVKTQGQPTQGIQGAKTTFSRRQQDQTAINGCKRECSKPDQLALRSEDERGEEGRR